MTEDTIINLAHRGLSANEIFSIYSSIKDSQRELVCKTLKLGYNNFGDRGAEIVADYLEADKHVNTVDLCFNAIGDNGAKALSRCLTNNFSLRILYLSGNYISSLGFQYFGEALGKNCRLLALHLTGNCGHRDGAAFLAKGLLSNYHLQELCVNGNKLCNDGIKHICDTLNINHTLRELSFGNNEINDEGVSFLARALKSHKFLTSLDLSFNKITDQGIEQLCMALEGYESLNKLRLDNNNIGSRGASCIARILPSMMLKELNVGFNNIKPDGISSLLQALNPNHYLHSLVLSGNFMNAEVSFLMANTLKVDDVLEELYLDRIDIGEVGEKNISIGLSMNSMCPLRKLTGFHLGRVLVMLGSPPELSTMTNEVALQYLRSMWRKQKQSEEYSDCFDRKNIPGHNIVPESEIISKVKDAWSTTSQTQITSTSFDEMKTLIKDEKISRNSLKPGQKSSQNATPTKRAHSGSHGEMNPKMPGCSTSLELLSLTDTGEEKLADSQPAKDSSSRRSRSFNKKFKPEKLLSSNSLHSILTTNPNQANFIPQLFENSYVDNDFNGKNNFDGTISEQKVCRIIAYRFKMI
jgi:Ran GTPase-activating protein (RanGAP) involved in mRNA processing and transport